MAGALFLATVQGSVTILHGLPDTALPSGPGSVLAERHTPVPLCQSSDLLCPLPLPTSAPSCKIHLDLLGQKSHSC